MQLRLIQRWSQRLTLTHLHRFGIPPGLCGHGARTPSGQCGHISCSPFGPVWPQLWHFTWPEWPCRWYSIWPVWPWYSTPPACVATLTGPPCALFHAIYTTASITNSKYPMWRTPDTTLWLYSLWYFEQSTVTSVVVMLFMSDTCSRVPGCIFRVLPRQLFYVCLSCSHADSSHVFAPLQAARHRSRIHILTTLCLLPSAGQSAIGRLIAVLPASSPGPPRTTCCSCYSLSRDSRCHSLAIAGHHICATSPRTASTIWRCAKRLPSEEAIVKSCIQKHCQLHRQLALLAKRGA